jgi:hypothetical protein
MSTSAFSRFVTRLPSFFLVALLVIPASLFGQRVTGRMIGSVYSWEQFDTVDVSKKITRGVQSLFLDITQSHFSLHTHLQVASALQRKLDEEPDFRTFYLYARMKNIAEAVDLSFGRLPFFVGAGSGTLDGLQTTLRLDENRYRVTLFGGAITPASLNLKQWKSLDKNFTLGGQFLTYAITNTRVGLSYVNRQRERDPYFSIRTDSLFNPFAVLVAAPADKEQYGSVDILYDFQGVTAYGRYDYNFNDSKSQREQVRLSYDATKELTVTGDFIHREPRVPFNSFFSVFDYSSISEFEVGADYVLCPSLRGFLRGAYVKYSDENSWRYTVGLSHTYAGFTYRGGSGYAGELNTVSVQGLYPLIENMLIPNASFALTSYRLNPQDSRETAYAASLGTTVRPLQTLSFDLQAQWVHNRVVERDVRFFGRFNFWFTEQFHFFDGGTDQ